MITERQKKESTLRQLLDDSFKISGYCRKSTETMKDVSLKYYFQSIASRRSQFAMEIGDEISYLFGMEPYITSGAYDRIRKEPEELKKSKILKMAIRMHKESLKKYQEALCYIHEGSCREILLRHKAFIENCIFELRSIKSLLKYNHEENRELKRA